MKLLEIALKQVQTKTQNTNRIIPTKLPTGLQYINAGTEAVVYQNKKPSAQGMIIKTIQNSSHSSEQNGTIQYLIRGNDANNTLIPVVYNIKQIQIGDRYTFTIQMEKLQPLTDRDVTDSLLCQALLSSLLNPTDVDNPMHFDDTETFGELVSDILSGTATTVNVYGVERTISKFAIQFRHLLHDISQTTGYDLDIHDDNIMIRRTSVGAQLVITDPLWGARQ